MESNKILEYIVQITKQHSNDQELGKIVRRYVNKIITYQNNLNKNK